jgi:GTP cyclohydrolase I
MIVQRDIPFVSLCNHHVLPFIGVAHIGYIPSDKNVGLSKFGRVVHHFARRLQVQERMTTQISSFLSGALNPVGLAVVVEAEHLCMTIRGVQVPGTRTSTQKMTGVFADHTKTAKMEFLSRINGGHK